ncbi:MAG: class II fructose-bisphosphate aldolase [Clostridia bacterium]|nr:class II fructose-bisphosphate aldolase [Clostridia bacterium]
MFTDTRKMLNDAMRGGYAVGAFNFENMEMALAIVRAADGLGAPVILQTTPSTVKYASAGVFAAIGRAAAESVAVPVAVHLDHGDSRELCFEAVNSGYSSVMIDASRLPLAENIADVAAVTAFCRQRGIPVEAELGRVGGKEDSLSVKEDIYTDPGEACAFVEETGISSLAVAIGTAHGVYHGTPVLDVGRLSEIREALERKGLLIPLVLHGASGLSDESVRDCVSRGICKVNFATELRQAYTSAVRETLAGDGGIFDPKKYGKPAMEAVGRLVAGRVGVLGSAGKAKEIR